MARPAIIASLLVLFACQAPAPASDGPRNPVETEDKAPLAKIVSPLPDAVVESGLSVVLEGDVSDAEDEASELVVWWESSVDGLLVAEAPAGADGAVSGSAVLSVGQHTVSLWVRDTAGNVGSAEVAPIVVPETTTTNTPPWVQLEAPVSGSVVRAGTAVELRAQVSDDEEPSALALTWESDVDGVFSSQSADDAGQAQLFADGLSPGVHTVTVTATDAGGLWSTDATSFTVDVGPSAPVVSLTPAAPLTGDDLVVRIDAEAVDPEGDNVTYTYAWEVDGTAASQTTATLPSSATAKGERWRVLVTSSDPHGAGLVGTAEVVVGNTPPVAVWSDLTAGDLHTDDVLTAVALGSDVDLDPVTLARTWRVDGVLLPLTGSTLDGAVYFDPGQVVLVEVVPNDGTEDGAPLTQSWTVVNAPPTAPVVEIDPVTPTVDDDLLCRVSVPSTDADGDPIIYSVSWTVDGAPFGGAVTTNEVGDTVVAADTSHDETWECTVTATDGWATGAPGTASVALPFGCPAGMVRIPGGTFAMGSPAGEVGRGSDETLHQVTLTRDYCLGETEVTQAQWEAVMGGNPSRNGGCPRCPVEYVTWHDAAEFANRLSASEGLTECYTCSGGTCDAAESPYSCGGYRLPTEAEWERAARAGLTGAAFPNGGRLHAGDEIDCGGNLVLTDGSELDEVAWYCGNGGGREERVGQLLPNPYGLYDISGNVLEWVHDWYGAYPGAVVDPYGPGGGFHRVYRGGSWLHAPRDARVAYRSWDSPAYRKRSLGLRLARSIP